MKPDEKIVADASEKILFPETMSEPCEFMGCTVKVRPLPIFYSKQIYKLMAPVQKKCMVAASKVQGKVKKKIKTSGKGKKIQLDNVGDLLEDSDMDEAQNLDMEFALTLVKVSKVLAEFYGIDKTVEEIEKDSSLEELEKLVNLQVEVNGQSDFLLSPLRATMLALSMMPKIENMNLQKNQ